MIANWFVWNNAKHSEAGPFTAATMQQLAEDGLITPDTFVRTNSASEWSTAVDAGFFPHAHSQSTPPLGGAPNPIVKSAASPQIDSQAPLAKAGPPKGKMPPPPMKRLASARGEIAANFESDLSKQNLARAVWALVGVGVLLLAVAVVALVLVFGGDSESKNPNMLDQTMANSASTRSENSTPTSAEQTESSSSARDSVQNLTNNHPAPNAHSRQEIDRLIAEQKARDQAAIAERQAKERQRLEKAEAERQARERDAETRRRIEETERIEREKERLRVEREQAEAKAAAEAERARLEEEARKKQEALDDAWKEKALDDPFIQRRLGESVEHPHEKRIDAALLWLAHHQHEDGYWSAKKFRESSQRIAKEAAMTGNIEFLNSVGADDFGDERCNVGLSGMALLAFAGEGETIRPCAHREVVRKGLDWLLSQQDEDGCFGARDGDEFIYNHAYCTQALCEHLALSLDESLRAPAQRAVDFICEAQNPDLGWRYGIKPGDNDSSVTAAMILALHTADQAGLSFPKASVYAGANKWFDLVIGLNEDGLLSAGYRGPAMRNARLASTEQYDRNATIDCCAILTRLLTGKRSRKDKQEVKPLLERLDAEQLVWNDHKDGDSPEHKIDMYFWRVASEVRVLIGGDEWDDWQESCFDEILLPNQRGWHASDVKAFGRKVRTTGDGESAGCWLLDEHGSWDPVGAWGSVGGRVYSTCMAVLTLQAGYRYEVAD